MSSGGKILVDPEWVQQEMSAALNRIKKGPPAQGKSGSAGRARSQGAGKEQVWACGCGLPGSTSNWLSRTRCRACGKRAPQLAATGDPPAKAQGDSPSRAKSQERKANRGASPSKWDRGPPKLSKGERHSVSPGRVRFAEPNPPQGAPPMEGGSGELEPSGAYTATRPWDLQFKAQSDRLIHLEKAHAKAHEDACRCSQVVQGITVKLETAREELTEALEEEARRGEELQAGQQELEALRLKVADPPQGERIAKLVKVLKDLGGFSLTWEQSTALEELQLLVAPGEGAATAPAAGSGAVDDPYSMWNGGGGQPTGHAGTGPPDEGLNEDGGDGSPPPDGGQAEETVTPIPSPMPADDPEETESVGGVDHDMEDGDTPKPHKRSQSLPGGGRSKRGRSPAKRAEKPTRDIHKVKADAKGKKGKAGEARQGVLTFAKAAARVELDAAIGGAEGSSSHRADLSHRGQGSVPAV